MDTKHQVMAIHQAFPTKDDHIAFTVGGSEQWTVFLEVIGRLYILSEVKYRDRYSRAQNMNELEPIINEALSHGTTDEWIKKFEEVAIPCSRINNIAQASQYTQLLHRNMFVDLPCPVAKGGVLKVSNSPFKLSRTPPQVVKVAPGLGEHSEEVLSALLGMDETTINSLKTNGVITHTDNVQ